MREKKDKRQDDEKDLLTGYLTVNFRETQSIVQEAFGPHTLGGLQGKRVVQGRGFLSDFLPWR